MPTYTDAAATTVALFVILLVLVGCVAVLVLSDWLAGPNDLAGTWNDDEPPNIGGFWDGFWHGSIAPVSFLISLFDDRVNIYEPCNNGGWYNFGFALGIGVFTRGVPTRRYYPSRKRHTSNSFRPYS